MPIPLSSQPIRRLVRRHATGFCKRLPSIAANAVLAVCTGAGIPVTASGGDPERVKVAFYNTENLFDTIRNPLIADGEYTPQGTRRWDTQRYGCKIGRIARVLDELDADVVGLAEVENEAVVCDLMFAMRHRRSVALPRKRFRSTTGESGEQKRCTPSIPGGGR